MIKPNRRLSVFFFGLVVSVGASLAPSRANAEISLTVQPGLPQSLGGDTPYFRNTVTIKGGGILSVIPVGTMGGTGRLHIKANRIIIEADALLDASGAGHRGMSGAAGTGPGGGGFLAAAAGGGGAYFGNGGTAVNAACMPFGLGGASYGVAGTPGLGSAGGSGGTMPGPIGAAGGGSIILEAALIEVNGEINANGENGISLGGVGSGGGAGGEIRLIAHTLVWGTKAKVTAAGGLGAKAANSSGGSGGGGLIFLRGAPAPMDPAATLNIAGGVTAEAACAQGAGQNGTIDQDTAQMCPDLDGDGVLASLCAGNGEDCDDADPLINPSAMEKCDSVDNNCDGNIDEGQTDCAMGLTCQAGKCVGENLPDAGPPSDAGAAPPEMVAYRGGCAATGSLPAREGTLAAGLLLAAAASTIRSRRARRPS